jgi:2-haloacid dehalogenase
MILDSLLVEFGIYDLTETEKVEFNRVWHRLKPWPDAQRGLTRLRRGFILGTLSNGHVALLANLSKNAGLSWDVILSAEFVKHYKPDPEVYRMAPDMLDLRPDEVMLAASHPGDLLAARAVGLRTALILRPLEYGPNFRPEIPANASFDRTADDLEDLAAQFGW